MNKFSTNALFAILVTSAAGSASTSAFIEWIVEPGKQIGIGENILVIAAAVAIYATVVWGGFYLMLPDRRPVMRDIMVHSRFHPRNIIARVRDYYHTK